MQTCIGRISLHAGSGSADGAYRDALGDGAPEIRKVIEDHGGKLTESYLTMGQFDSVAVMQLPDAVTCAQAILALREQFGLGTQTLQAFPESQWPEVAQRTQRRHRSTGARFERACARVHRLTHHQPITLNARDWWPRWMR